MIQRAQKNPRSGYGEHAATDTGSWDLVKEKTDFYEKEEIMLFAVRNEEYMQQCQQNEIGIPAAYYDADYAKFRFDVYSVPTDKLKKVPDSFAYKFDAWWNAGKCLYLWSKTPGSGKTLLACSLARTVMVGRDLSVRFVTAPDYMDLVVESYKRERGSEDRSEIYKTCDLLILDDIGAQKSGEWQGQEMFKAINTRLNNRLLTLYTSNSKPEDLNLDERTIDRIIRSAMVLQMPEESIRRKEAREENNSFARKMGLM